MLVSLQDLAQGGFQARISSHTLNCQMQHAETLLQNLKENKETRLMWREEERNEKTDIRQKGR